MGKASYSNAILDGTEYFYVLKRMDSSAWTLIFLVPAKICSNEYGKACEPDHVVYHSVCSSCSSLCNYSYRNSA